ncbi:hypothetical protein QE152_g9269 [Popillia japonica]|uniref:Uncharacterized protein n=1 Tax=Popillia japonica TaxID=7064 RepID=A0AAW1LYG1_POPJA
MEYLNPWYFIVLKERKVPKIVTGRPTMLTLKVEIELEICIKAKARMGYRDKDEINTVVAEFVKSNNLVLITEEVLKKMEEAECTERQKEKKNTTEIRKNKKLIL